MRPKWKKLGIILIVLVFIIFYIGYSFSERGDVQYRPATSGNVDVIPNSDNYSSGQEVKVKYTTASADRKVSLLRPLLGVRLRIATVLRNPRTHMELNGNKIKPDNIEEKVVQGFKWNIIYFDIPKEQDELIRVYLEGEVPEIQNRDVAFVQIVQRNQYLFGNRDYYKNQIRRMVK